MADQNMRLRVVLDLADKALAPLKRIGQGSKETAATLKAAREQLKQLQAAQADISSFRRLQSTLKETEASLVSARQKSRSMANELALMEKPSLRVSAAVIKAAEATNKLGAKFNSQQQQLKQLAGRLDATGVDVRDLAQNEQQLSTRIASTSANIEAQTRALKRQSEERRRLSKIQQQASRAAAFGAGMAATGAASIYAGKQAMRPVMAAGGAFAAQEDASTQLRASMMRSDGTVSAEFAQIDALAKKLGDRLPGTTADFIDMMSVLSQQGLTPATILGGTGEAAALLGVQLRMPATAAAEFAAKMQDATRTSEKDMLGLMDTIQRSYYLGVDSSNMLQGFSKLSPVMSIVRQEGLEFSKSMAPLLVMMDQTGMAGESAGNAIRKVFQGGLDAKKMEKANDLLKDARAGFRLKFTGAKGEFLGLDNVFNQLDKLKGLGDNAVLRASVMKAVFGDDSDTLQVLNTMMDKGRSGYAEVATKLQAQADLQQRVNEQLGTLTNVVDAAQGSATNALAAVGEAMAPDLKNLVNWLSSAGSAANTWAKENQQLVRWLGMGALGLSAFMVAAGALLIPLGLLVAKGMAVRWMLAKLGMTTGPITLLKGLFSWGARMLPMLIRIAPMLLRVLGPIGLLASAAWMLYSNWDAVVGGATQLWQNFSSWVGGIWTSLTTTMAAAWQGIVARVQAVLAGGIAGWAQALLNFNPLGILWFGITTALSALGIQVPQQFRTLGGFIVDGIIGGITARMAALRDTVVGVASSAASWFKEKLGIASPSKVFTQFGGWISEGAANGIQAGQSGVRAAALAMAGAAITPVGAAEPGTGVSLGGTGPAIAARPAMGGAGGAMGGGSYQITIHPAPGMDANAIARAVAAELDKRERAAGARRRSALHDQN